MFVSQSFRALNNFKWFFETFHRQLNFKPTWARTGRFQSRKTILCLNNSARWKWKSKASMLVLHAFSRLKSSTVKNLLMFSQCRLNGFNFFPHRHLRVTVRVSHVLPDNPNVFAVIITYVTWSISSYKW